MVRRRQQSETWFLRSLCTCDERDPVPQLRSRYTNNIHALTSTRHHLITANHAFARLTASPVFLFPTQTHAQLRDMCLLRVCCCCVVGKKERMCASTWRTHARSTVPLHWYAAWSTHAMCISCRQCRCLRSENKSVALRVNTLIIGANLYESADAQEARNECCLAKKHADCVYAHAWDSC